MLKELLIVGSMLASPGTVRAQDSNTLSVTGAGKPIPLETSLESDPDTDSIIFNAKRWVSEAEGGFSAEVSCFDPNGQEIVIVNLDGVRVLAGESGPIVEGNIVRADAGINGIYEAEFVPLVPRAPLDNCSYTVLREF